MHFDEREVEAELTCDPRRTPARGRQIRDPALDLRAEFGFALEQAGRNHVVLYLDAGGDRRRCGGEHLSCDLFHVHLIDSDVARYVDLDAAQED